DRAAADVLSRNIAALALPGATLVRRSVANFLAGDAGEPFDLVFADPPYALDDAELAEVLSTLAGDRWLAPDAVVVVERSARSPGPVWPECITPVQDRHYGEGVLWYGRRR